MRILGQPPDATRRECRPKAPYSIPSGARCTPARNPARRLSLVRALRNMGGSSNIDTLASETHKTRYTTTKTSTTTVTETATLPLQTATSTSTTTYTSTSTTTSTVCWSQSSACTNTAWHTHDCRILDHHPDYGDQRRPSSIHRCPGQSHRRNVQPRRYLSGKAKAGCCPPRERPLASPRLPRSQAVLALHVYHYYCDLHLY